jgi:tetratricopeptide (TPR) repeat protein
MAKRDIYDTETQDAFKVIATIDLINKGKLSKAEQILVKVISNAPSDYKYQYEKDGKLFVKCWTLEEFLSFYQRLRSIGNRQDLAWIPSAYPRAFFYMAFIKVEQGDFLAALHFLDEGIKIEPANLNFHIERANVLSLLNNHEAALKISQDIAQKEEDITKEARARALRGMGVEMIELGNLDGAEACLRESLKIEPENMVANDELLYIGRRRTGGPIEPAHIIRTYSNHNKCEICGAVVKKGRVMMVGLKKSFVCSRCQAKMKKRWWQFWK